MSNSPKFIVVTGGVLSGLGKGIAAASIGNLLSHSLKVIPIKCDGYLNTDPGTMNPIEHGEVFVLDDGGEVDMDFGHYERFLGISCKSKWNLTMGKVFEQIRKKERKGDYLGKTVQFIPHVPRLILDWWMEIALEEEADVVLIEIGGTVGDIENELYIEAARQLKKLAGEENVLYIHLTYIPIPGGTKEQKSKPTQQSVNLLRQKGITPQLLFCRCSHYLTKEIKEKLANLCDVEEQAIITCLDVDSVYKVPLILQEQGIVGLLQKYLKLNITADTTAWKNSVEKVNNGSFPLNVAICGKYTQLEDSYASVIEAVHHAATHLDCKINLTWIDTTDEHVQHKLEGIDAIIVPGGFGSRGVEGKINVIRYARENNIPLLGLCYGLQLAVIEFARSKLGLTGANSTEIDPTTPYPLIDILPEQHNVTDKGATMRLGDYQAEVKPATKVCSLYHSEQVHERHRHRYEVNPIYHQALQQAGLIFSGTSHDSRLVEFIELANHPFFIATQAHPELKSSLMKPAPLFYGLIEAAKKKKYATEEISIKIKE